MSDNEVDKKLRKPDPKRTGNSVTGKPLDKINTNPQLDVKEQQEEAEVLSIIEQLEQLMQEELEEEGLLGEALDIEQRLKRGRIMRRYSRKIQRAKELAQRKLADQPHLKRRAYRKAREAVRRIVAGETGANYQELGPSEKIRIDRMVDAKAKLIKKLADRYMPKVRTAEMQRLHSFIKGQSMQNQGQPEGKIRTEDFEIDINSNKSINEAIKSVIETTEDPRFIPLKRDFSMNKLIETLDSMIEKKIEISERSFEALKEKAETSGIKFSTLVEVFKRGYNSNRNPNLLPEQLGFARVNSFIKKGKTYYTEDSDLVKPITEMRKINGRWQKVIVEERTPEPVTKKELDDVFEQYFTAIDEVSKEDIPTEKRKKTVNVPREGTGNVSMTRQGEIERKVNESLNESFNIAYSAGVGITLTAKDLGMVTKGGFELHPSVIEEIDIEEEVKTADKEPVVVPSHKDAHGNVIPSKTVMRKKNKTIINTGNVHDGDK